MRRLDDIPIDPDVAASLDAIDAALAGEPVDPSHAEVAELALLLSAERPAMSGGAARSLDERVRTRFGARGARSRRRAWPTTLTSMAAAAAAVAIVAVVLSSSNPPAVRSSSTPNTAEKSPPRGAASIGAASSAGSSSAAGSSSVARAAAAGSSSVPRAAVAGSSSAGSSSAGSSLAAGSAGTASIPAPLTAPGTGRKAIQSAQLQLSAAPNRVDDVAQEVFDVVGSVHGYVSNSTVTQTGGSDGSANLQLTVPAASLGQTMTELSRLAHAQVTSRTDGIQDVTDEYGAAQRRVGDAQARRTGLLKQLANAQTTGQINSLNAQIRDADAAIAAARTAVASLNQRINNVQITVTINAAPAVPVAHSSTFTIGKAAHDAGRVLVVAAGVALIVLAVLVPVALLAALLWWAGALARRRRREQALDAA
jgi:hypothetical protein